MICQLRYPHRPYDVRNRQGFIEKGYLTSLNKAVFLDRDGVINVDKGYVYKIEDFEYLEGAIDNLRKYQKLGFLLIVITNQSGIARGYFTEEQYLALERWMISDLRSKGIFITACFYCPHLPDAIVPKYRCKCDCRKPGTALFHKAAEMYDIDLSESIAIGDKARDLTICNESGARGILLSNGWKDFG